MNSGNINGSLLDREGTSAPSGDRKFTDDKPLGEVINETAKEISEVFAEQVGKFAVSSEKAAEVGT